MNEQNTTGPSKKTGAIVAGAVALIAVLALVAVLSTRGSKTDSASADPGPTGFVAPASEYGTVTTNGTPLAPYPESGEDPAIGAAAPVLTGQSLSDKSVSTSGKPALMMFVAHWCPHCQKEVPAVTKWAAAKGGLGDVRLIAISTSAKEAAPNFPPSKWLHESGLPADIIRDDEAGTAGAAFGLTSFPYFVAVDGSGRVKARIVGELTDSQLDDLLATVSN